jgi:membrane protease YdiL (CAAX protease family)
MVVAAFNGLRQVYPRSSLQKGAFTVAVVLLNPITEEWLYRGVAVVWLANQTHPLPAVCFGLAVSLSVHAYQGLFLAPFQFAFHAIACALVFSPLGLLGAMGFHFLGDAYPMYRLRKQMPFWIAERRKQISTARNAKFAMESSHHDR